MKNNFLAQLRALCTVILVFHAYGIAAQGKVNNKTNIVVIVCDDLNDALSGFGGHPSAKTPKLDAIRKMGVTFTNAQANAPICSPSRASLWSGLYPHTTGFYGYNQQLNHWSNNFILKDAVTVFEHLASNGYQVFGSGKIHHNGHEKNSIFLNEDGRNGFKIAPSFGPYPWDGDPKNNTSKKRGIGHPDLPSNYDSSSWSSGFGSIKNISQEFNGKGTWLYTHGGEEFKYISRDNRDLMPDERIANYAQEVLNEKHEKPFFITLGLNRPHSPFYAPEEYFDRFPLDSIELTPMLKNDLADVSLSLSEGLDTASRGIGFHKYNMIVNAGGNELLLRWTQAYLACVAFVDDQIGEVVEAIENSDYADNTLIIITSDHGYHMGEKEYIFKNTVWEESCRIPMIVIGPDVAKNKTCEQPISLIDIYPTIVDYSGVPKNPNTNTNGKLLDGYSLRPFLEDPEKGIWQGPNFALSAVASAKELGIDEPGAIADQHFSLRTKQYRYILTRSGEEELYDHKRDPNEWENQAYKPKYDKVKKELHSNLKKYLKRNRG